ncbi:MAG: 3-phosphoshikimate 1-carboxyvinyltransferase [Gammaproteobacteria bacterium]|jgi:3-phosphoshikimate 1-carboxyvinyltransferase|nr:3-phosphoshikimate 1-carboxyvinyltransferase [Gammaproteobacteria bacterium]
MTRFVCKPGGSLDGNFRVPGDKSISHRSIILASIADGSSHISGFLQGEDSLNTMRAFQQMGVPIARNQGEVTVSGVGLHGLQAPATDLDMGNSGTAMRLLLGLLAGQSFDARLIGDSSLSSRPMLRVIQPLQQMGAVIESADGGRAPLQVRGGQVLESIDYRMPVASAQVKSCLLLAGLYARGETIVHEPAPTRDHSERMLRGFGCDVASNAGEIRLRGNQALSACDIDVPADISSAAFFMVAASIASDSDITLQHVGINPTRTGVIDILKLMGADIDIVNRQEIGGEPVADIRVCSAALSGIEIPESLVPLAIDEFPVLFVAAACAVGETRLSGAEELRVKESDRIQAMADGLTRLGIETEVKPDGIIIQGGKLGGGEIDSHGDHRIAMAFSVASLAARRDICIRDCSNVNTSFPGFAELAQRAGIRISIDAG